MVKPLFLAVHGMGDHTAKDLKENVLTPLDKATEYYSSLEKFSDSVEFVPITYDEEWNEIRKRLADNAGTVEERLSGLGGAAQIANKLNEFEAKFGKDSFFYTHWLDVILYRTFYGEMVRVKVAKAILDNLIKAKSEQRPIHILAHSLGTAVVHDTLHKLYQNDFTQKEKAKAGLDKHQVDPEENQLDSIFLIANVSRIVGGGKDPYQSVVKPGTGGICHQMVNVRHVLDPFTLPKPFNPPVNGSWVPTPDLANKVFRLIETKAVTDFNVHSLSHYLSNPSVHDDVFSTVFGRKFKPTSEEKEKARRDFDGTTIQGGFEKVKAAADALDIKNADSIEQFVEEGEKFLQQLKSLKP